jgi:hypothetical protein
MQRLNAQPLDNPFEDFLGHALTHVHDHIDFTLVERLAEQLLAERQLLEQDVVQIVGAPMGPRFLTDYRMHRMHGQRRIRAAWIASTKRSRLN